MSILTGLKLILSALIASAVNLAQGIHAIADCLNPHGVEAIDNFKVLPKSLTREPFFGFGY